MPIARAYINVMLTELVELGERIVDLLLALEIGALFLQERIYEWLVANVLAYRRTSTHICKCVIYNASVSMIIYNDMHVHISTHI